MAALESHISRIERAFKQFYEQKIRLKFSVDSQYLYLVSSVCVYNMVQFLLSLFLLGL